MNKILPALLLGGAGWYIWRTFGAAGVAAVGAPPAGPAAGVSPAGGPAVGAPPVTSGNPSGMAALLEAKRLSLGYDALLTADEWNYVNTQLRGINYTFEQLNSVLPREYKMSAAEYAAIATSAGLSGILVRASTPWAYQGAM